MSLRCESPHGWVLVACSPHGSEVYFPHRCRRCDGCREAHRVGVRRRLEYAIGVSKGRAALVTFTSLPGTPWVEVMRSWQGMRAYLRRQGWAGSYAAVKEEGSETGMRHLHVIALDWKYVRWQLLRAEWERRTGAHQVDVRQIDDSDARRAAGYVAKYVSKATGALGGVRKKVTYGRGFPRPPFERRWSFRERMHWLDYGVHAMGARASAVMPGGGIVVRGSCECLGAIREWDWFDSQELARLSKRRPRPIAGPGRSGGPAKTPQTV